MTKYHTVAAQKGLRIAIVPRNRYLLRLKYLLLGYRISVRPTGINPHRLHQRVVAWAVPTKSSIINIRGQSPNDCAKGVSAPTAHCKGAEDCHVAIAPRNDGKIGGAQ